MQKKEILDLKLFGVRKTIGRALAVVLLGAGIYKLTEQTWTNSSFHEGNIGMGILEMIFPIFLCFLWVAGCLFWIKMLKHYKALKQRGIIVSGNIVNTQTINRFPQEALYFVTYEYKDTMGTLYKRQCSMRNQSYQQMQEYGYIQSDTIEIIYDPQNPKCAYPSVSII